MGSIASIDCLIAPSSTSFVGSGREADQGGGGGAYRSWRLQPTRERQRDVLGTIGRTAKADGPIQGDGGDQCLGVRCTLYSVWIRVGQRLLCRLSKCTE